MHAGDSKKEVFSDDEKHVLIEGTPKGKNYSVEEGFSLGFLRNRHGP
ncbi:hypothetical protein N781_06235 [Pontibacillus halophilus JSM 076056 = DSM 19796]|uniref:Uncharacterized protein n=1 Tax=Pontibacillus halophilus JSM 076056 = DSM 19796 TaxID=1385510 RepID=A0A0A5GHZ6_9BACI|nr:hypothetical protein [Pontibacillus halophilus]KGX90745.1 hypothetical protein N781_06235 [Pontibacillus halophilus JSM 076056 = DSM 19796]